jgi:hypothetical protein
MNQATNITGRTPARAELAAHLNKLRKAIADAESANRPLQRVRAQVQMADASHAAAESALSAIDESEAASVRKHVASGVWPIPELSREQRESRSDAEAAVATARRAASTVRQNSVIAQTKYDQVSQAVAEIAGQTSALVEGVLSDEADAALEKMRASLIAAAEAESEVNAFSEFFAAQGMLRSAEPVNIARNTMARPLPKPPNTLAVIGLALALETNADATLTAP